MPENMSEKIGINPCLEAGCNGACCRDMQMFDFSREQQVLSYPTAIDITVNDEVDDMPDGVYYCAEDQELFIIGDCPHLSNGNCSIFGEPNRPEHCANFVQGSKDCANQRIIDGQPVPLETILRYQADPTLIII